MENWKKINEMESDKLWRFVFENLTFRPYDKANIINLPIPHKTFDISGFYNEGFSEFLYNELHATIHNWFKGITNGTRMYALNWQHDCYSFTTDLPFEKDEFGEWLISAFPNSDYIFFITDAFSNGFFGDGINKKIFIWGKEIINASQVNMPRILSNNLF